jgi:hypothetical protein
LRSFKNKKPVVRKVKILIVFKKWQEKAINISTKSINFKMENKKCFNAHDDIKVKD